MSRRFPMERAMALGLGALGWSPDAFWQATPRELLAALGHRGEPAASATRAEYEALKARFPDR
jgi:uncharacterized phage protein (TIGR02216 family)